MRSHSELVGIVGDSRVPESDARCRRNANAAVGGSMLFWRITQEAERRSGSMCGGVRTFSYANWDYRTAAGG
jgi:hypothetical protein